MYHFLSSLCTSACTVQCSRRPGPHFVTASWHLNFKAIISLSCLVVFHRDVASIIRWQRLLALARQMPISALAFAHSPRPTPPLPSLPFPSLKDVCSVRMLASLSPSFLPSFLPSSIYPIAANDKHFRQQQRQSVSQSWMWMASWPWQRLAEFHFRSAVSDSAACRLE